MAAPELANLSANRKHSLQVAQMQDVFLPGRTKMIRVCVAGATGWVGSTLTRELLRSEEFQLTGVICRHGVGEDIGSLLGGTAAGLRTVRVVSDAARADVLIDYTGPDSVKARVMEALNIGFHVVIGTSGLTANDYDEIAREAEKRALGVIAAGNFSLTAALAKHLTLLAARHIRSCEIIDYADPQKPDAPSGTARELAEELATMSRDDETGQIRKRKEKDARGANIAGTRVHSLRLPSYVLSFEALLGLPHERLTIRHDAGASAHPYVAGTLLAVREVMGTVGLTRGLDRLLFQ